MDRAEAIWYLQPIADSASLERYKEALNMAIAALREQEQREQGCSWCKAEYTIVDDDFGQPVRPSMVKFCFRCGRKLKVGG